MATAQSGRNPSITPRTMTMKPPAMIAKTSRLDSKLVKRRIEKIAAAKAR